MAHTCPECGQACHCGVDIDDCLNDFEQDIINCTHYLICEDDDESEIDYYGE